MQLPGAVEGRFLNLPPRPHLINNNKRGLSSLILAFFRHHPLHHYHYHRHHHLHLSKLKSKRKFVLVHYLFPAIHIHLC